MEIVLIISVIVTILIAFGFYIINDKNKVIIWRLEQQIEQQEKIINLLQKK